MSRSKAFGKGSETNQSPRNGPFRAAADICDSLRHKEQCPAGGAPSLVLSGEAVA
jgi:hypothetical protein